MSCLLEDYIIDCAAGPFGSNLKVNCFVEEGFPIIDGANLQGVKLTDNITKFVTEEKARTLGRSIAKRYDVVVTISGTLGQIAFIPSDSKYEEYLCSQRQFRVTFDKSLVDVEYLTYYFHTKEGQKKILAFANYVGVPALSSPLLNFKKIEVDFPSIDEQKRIVAILQTLDAKIALNRRMNEELEGMAKMLYDYWFVQFDFPNEEGKPYKSSGGAMEYNAVLKREIPAGWKVKSIQEQFDVVMERISKEDTSQSNYAPIEVLPKRRMSFFECAPIESAISGLCKFEKFDVLLSNRRVYFHKVCIAPFAGITRDTVIVLRPLNMERLPYAYQVLNTDHFISFATRHSYGTEQPVFSWDVTRKYYVAESNCSLEGEYSNRMKSLVQKVIGLQHEIKNLTALRDKLLPLLMNGQVRVAD